MGCSDSAAWPPYHTGSGNVSVSSGQIQAHLAFSSPAKVVGISVTYIWCRTLLLFGSFLQQDLHSSFCLWDVLALNMMFPGQVTKYLLFVDMPKMPVKLYETICHGSSYGGRGRVGVTFCFLIIDVVAHFRI